MKMLKEVLQDIKPSKEEEKEVSEKINLFITKLNKNLKDAKAILGGSGAKGTWLSHAYDADVFVQFDYKKFQGKSDELSDILEKALRKIFPKIKRLHGSRDYFQINDKEFTFEAIPILKIKRSDEAVNITDVSPLHADWVKKHKKFADEIRITKQFCKAVGVYGAESYVKGFSGYMCEILTINYKGFLNLVKAASKWEPKTVVDTEKYYKNKNDVIMSINKSKQQGPMIIIDPVQKDRNAAAVLSDEKYNAFISACKSFVKKPSKDFFMIKEISEEELRKKAIGKKLILLDAKPLSGKEDVVGSKLLKLFEFVKKNLEDEEFKVYDSGWKWEKEDEALMWFILDKKELSEFEFKQGPPVDLEKHAETFKKIYKGKTSVKDGKLVAKVKREFRNPEELIKKLIKDEYVKDKVVSINVRR